MKRCLGLESKSLGGCRWPSPPGLGTDSFGLGIGICGLTASACLVANPFRGHDVCNILTESLAYWPGARERFFIEGWLLPSLSSPSPPFQFPSPSYPVL